MNTNKSGIPDILHEVDVFREIIERNPKIGERVREQLPRARIAAALVRVRNALGLTQKDVARLMGAEQPNIARLEKASGNPQTTEALAAYAQACGLTLGLVFMCQGKNGVVIVEGTAIDEDERYDQFLRSAIVPMPARADAAAAAAAAAVAY
jgi:transcriptional regulator with XRE-family HTH domain